MQRNSLPVGQAHLWGAVVVLAGSLLMAGCRSDANILNETMEKFHMDAAVTTELESATMGFWDAMSCGILVSTTGRPEGPYTDTSAERLVDNLDGSLFVEDDGTVYFIYKDGVIAPLNEDLSGFAGDFTSLYAADGLHVGFEGCSILKHNGKYYLTAATYNQSYDANGNIITTYDSMIAVSDNLMGPYSETRLLMRNGGHNNLFVDKEGRVWTTLFAPTGNLGFNCQPAIVPLTEDERGILTVAP